MDSSGKQRRWRNMQVTKCEPRENASHGTVRPRLSDQGVPIFGLWFAGGCSQGSDLQSTLGEERSHVCPCFRSMGEVRRSGKQCDPVEDRYAQQISAALCCAEAQISESSGKRLRVRNLAIRQSTLPKDGSPPTVQNSDLQSTLAKQG